MFCQDLSFSLLTMAEARNHWVLSGLLDVVGGLAQIISYGVSVGSIVTQGFLKEQTIVIIAAVSVANFVGTAAGVLIGKKWITADYTQSATLGLISLGRGRKA